MINEQSPWKNGYIHALIKMKDFLGITRESMNDQESIKKIDDVFSEINRLEKSADSEEKYHGFF